MSDSSFSNTVKNTSCDVYLLDISHMLFRAYHALPPLTRDDGKPVGALYGFVNILFKLLTTHQPRYLAAVFDSPDPSFRNNLFPAYKANRPPPPPDLAVQFNLAKDACMALGIAIIQKNGMEADDIMATLSTNAKHQKLSTALVSSDKDLMQLLDTDIHLFDAMKNKWIDANGVIEKFGVPPAKVIQVQALMGDSSDNIPGVPGIGPKTASSLLQQHQNLEELYAQLPLLKQTPRIKNLLIQHKEQAFLSRQLATLAANVPLNMTLEDMRFTHLDTDKALPFLHAQGFQSLAKRLEGLTGHTSTDRPTTNPQAIKSVTLNTVILRDINAVKQFTENAFHEGTLLVGGDVHTQGIFLVRPSGSACWIPASLATQHMSLWVELFTDVALTKIVHDQLTFLRALPTHVPRATEDISAAAYLLHGPQANTPQHYQHLLQTHALETVQPSVHWSAAEELDGNPTKALIETAMLWPLWRSMRTRLTSKGLYNLYRTLDTPVAHVISNMEKNGMGIDIVALKDLGNTFGQHIDHVTEKAYKLAGKSFNLASPKQLAHILFEEIGLKPVGRKGKSGIYSTDSDVLETLDHPLAEVILRFRHYAKLKNTYIEGLQKAQSPQTGRIHSTFSLTTTATGRLASRTPNLQNIPVREEEGRAIRRCFCPAPGNHFLSLDYAQIELRLLAHMGSVETLQKAFSENQDIHITTAAEMFEVPPDNVTASQRRTAKMINFGIIYGISAYGLAKRLDITQSKAATYIKHYLARYEGIQDYMDNCIAHARRSGYVETLWGRKLYVPNITARPAPVRTAAERLAINAPLQGTSADITKKAMLKIQNLLSTTHPTVRLVLQVHDELLFEGPPKILEEVTPVLKNTMETIAHLSVPLPVTHTQRMHWD